MTDYPTDGWVELASGLWQLTAGHSMPIHRNMIVMRLGAGDLALHSVIETGPEELAELESFGTPRYMLIPHAKHSMDAAFYAERYPQMKVAAPQQSIPEITKRRCVEVDGTPEEVLEGTELQAIRLEGVKFYEYAFIYPYGDGEGRAVVFNDMLANDGRETDSFTGRVFGKLSGVPGGGFGVSRAGSFFTSDREQLARSFEMVADAAADADLLTVSHGAPLRGDIATRLREVAAGLR